MSMLERVRSKPAGEKNKIALIVAGALTVLIVGIWFLAVRRESEVGDADANSTAEGLKPLFLIFKGAKEDIAEIKADVREHREETRTTTNVTE